MKQLLPLALALALTLAGCGAPSGEALPPQPSEGVETAAPIPTLTPSAKPIPTDGPYVYTDYSKLEDNVPRPNVYERWHGEFTDHLIPSPDYGHLLPFSGSAIADEWGGEYGTYALDGLMTLEGKVVVDPVYAAVTQLCSGGDYDYGYPDTYYPAFLLSRYAGDGGGGKPGALFGAYDDVRSVLCAADGSWVTPEYRFSYAAQVYGYGVQDGAIFALRDKNVLCLLDISTGEEIFSATLEGLEDETLNSVLDSVYYGDGRITLNVPMYKYNNNVVTETHSLRCWDINGREISLPDDVDVIYGFAEGLCPARRTGGTGYAWGYLGLDGQWAISPQFTDARAFEDGVALLGSHAHTLIDHQGNILYETPTYDHCQQTGDYWYFTGYSDDLGLVLDKEGNEVNSPLLHGGRVNVLNYGWAVMENPDGSRTLAKGEKSWAVPAGWDYIWQQNVTEDTVYLSSWAYSGDDPHWAIWRPETGEAPTILPGYLDSLRTDLVTGEQYCVIADDYSASAYHITDLNGKVLFDGLKGRSQLCGGRCLTSGSDNGSRWVELRDQGGSVLFFRRWASPFE